MDVRLCVFKGKLLFSVDNSCDDQIQITGNGPKERGGGGGGGGGGVWGVGVGVVAWVGGSRKRGSFL